MRGNDQVKSCIDLAIGSQNLLPFLKSILIDKNQNFTPRRIIRRNNKFTSVYTDHFSIEVTLVGMPRRKTLCVKSTTWNLGKPEGWKVYEKLTDRAAERIDDIVNNNSIHITGLCITLT